MPPGVMALQAAPFCTPPRRHGTLRHPAVPALLLQDSAQRGSAAGVAADDLGFALIDLVQGAADHFVGYGVGEQHQQIRVKTFALH